jgi:hypothetical protein
MKLGFFVSRRLDRFFRFQKPELLVGPAARGGSIVCATDAMVRLIERKRGLP